MCAREKSGLEDITKDTTWIRCKAKSGQDSKTVLISSVNDWYVLLIYLNSYRDSAREGQSSVIQINVLFPTQVLAVSFYKPPYYFPVIALNESVFG